MEDRDQVQEVLSLDPRRSESQVGEEPAPIDDLELDSEDKQNLSKKDLNIEQIYMFDRITGLNKNIFITDHINRSGVSFLRGKTPYKNLPMFPDMSKIYLSYKKKPGVVVHTLGPKNFKKPPSEKGVVFSESAAIFATLWRYIGVEVMCLGVGQPNQTKSFLDFI